SHRGPRFATAQRAARLQNIAARHARQRRRIPHSQENVMKQRKPSSTNDPEYFTARVEGSETSRLGLLIAGGFFLAAAIWSVAAAAWDRCGRIFSRNPAVDIPIHFNSNPQKPRKLMNKCIKLNAAKVPT